MFPMETSYVAFDNSRVLAAKVGHKISLTAYSNGHDKQCKVTIPDANCFFLSFNSFVVVRSQGPAVTLKITRNGREYSVDLTLAIKDKSWPEDAEEWPSRRDRNGILFILLFESVIIITRN